jgi:hypothetical protein
MSLYMSLYMSLCVSLYVVQANGEPGAVGGARLAAGLEI